MNHKTTDWKNLAGMLVTPAILVLLGLTLMIHPDFASALVGKTVGWVLVALAVAFGAAAVITRTSLPAKVLPSICFAIVGGSLVRDPLMLAAGLGRLLGIVLLFRGIHDILDSVRWKHGMIMSVIITLVGAVLVALPMTTSRLVLFLVGAVVTAIGIATAKERLGYRRLLQDPEDPNIIDAL